MALGQFGWARNSAEIMPLFYPIRRAAHTRGAELMTAWLWDLFLQETTLIHQIFVEGFSGFQPGDEVLAVEEGSP